MRLAFLLLPLLLFAGLVGHGLAQSPDASAPADVHLDVTAFDDGGRFQFFVVGHDGPSPTLELPAGAKVTVTLRNNGTVGHDLRIGAPVRQGTDVIAPGETATLVVSVPRDATRLAYLCTLHPTLGMRGAIEVLGGTPAASKETPAVPLSLLALALLAVAARR